MVLREGRTYEYMPNGSLKKHLYEPSSGHDTLNWSQRHKILSGVASALHYLHNEYDQVVIHRDLKASDILLDKDFNARLGDFGLAKALEAVGERLRNEFDEVEAKRVLLSGLACSHPIQNSRPKTQDIGPIISGVSPAPYAPPFRPVFMWPSNE